MYSFKYVFDHSDWYSLSDFPKDNDGNAIMYVDISSISKQPITISTPHWSFNDLPFSNGFSASKFSLLTKQINTLTTHIYKQPNPQTLTPNLLQSLDISFTSPTGPSHLSYLEVDLPSVTYQAHSGVVSCQFKDYFNSSVGPLTAYFFSSFQEDHPNLSVILSFRGNEYFNFNRVISWNPSLNVQQIDQSTYSSSVGFIYVMEYGLEDGYYGLTIDVGTKGSRVGGPQSFLLSELNWWASWHSSSVVPGGLNDKENSAYLQSLAILKMSQCRETTDNSYGQILASLPPGQWNICWIRDGSYAIMGLIHGGHFAEARDALKFFLDAKVGQYIHWSINGVDYGVGVPYQISVCRYYGDGTEWSDGDDDPNIELDGFGLFLWALESYITKSNDMNLLSSYWKPVIKPLIADVLVKVSSNPLNIVQKDSSIWERHLKINGEDGARHYSYTTITAIRGLEAAINLANLQNDSPSASLYTSAVNSLKNGFFDHCIDMSTGVVKDAIENSQITNYMDASVVEAINFGVLDLNANATIITNTLKAFDDYLSMKYRSNGFERSLGGSSYDSQEWIVMDLRIARAYQILKNTNRSSALVNWVVAQSSMNFNIMAELYDVYLANYSGAVPMCGFGPGAFIIYFWGL
eukprot:TRINITY_DN13255_c0_g1_i2.p1 TRINITY_DN13255_c0_g1~~TRINITY_DN13255_c0_g1_i2.p1  ORF type:complete len:721 (+),score=165.11 TRINITY_DN13255_c0_g1_i2:259-2163(+)